MARLTELDPSSTRKQLTDAMEASAQRTTKGRKNGNKPWFDEERRYLERTALGKLGTGEYQGPRRAYKDAARRKRIEYELKQLGEKVNASKFKPRILLPRKEPALIAKVDMEAFEEYYGKLYEDQELRTERCIASVFESWRGAQSSRWSWFSFFEMTPKFATASVEWSSSSLTKLRSLAPVFD